MKQHDGKPFQNMADIIILSFAVGLGLPQKIGIGNFVPIYLGVTNVLPILLTLFLHADRYWEYKEYGADIMNFRHSVTEIEQYDFIVGRCGFPNF